MINWYKILGIKPTASNAEIKKAFVKKVKDKTLTNQDKEEIKECLFNAENKREYDRNLKRESPKVFKEKSGNNLLLIIIVLILVCVVAVMTFFLLKSRDEKVIINEEITEIKQQEGQISVVEEPVFVEYVENVEVVDTQEIELLEMKAKLVEKEIQLEKLAQQELKAQQELQEKEEEARLKEEEEKRRLAAEANARRDEAKEDAFTRRWQGDIKQLLYDPSSAEFKYRVNSTKTKVCGTVNAKNRYGGYVGHKRFYVDYNKNEVALEGGRTFNDRYRFKCGTDFR